MSKKIHKKISHKRAKFEASGHRRITIHSVQRDQPDLRKLSRAVIALAQAEAEREAQAQHEIESPASGTSHD